MSRIKLVIIQFPRHIRDVEHNRALMDAYTGQIPDDADIVLLPEVWLGGEIMTISRYERIIFDLHAKIKAPDCLLVSGAQFVEAEGKLLSRGFFLSKSLPGPLYYDKQFPSNAVGERNYISKGSLLPVVEHRGLKVGCAVCVDLFYPEIARGLALRGAGIIFNPANIPTHRMALWQCLGTARASENTVFVAMANNTRSHYPDGRGVMGQSFVADPAGNTPHNCGEEPGVFSFEIDPGQIASVRERWRYLDDIKWDKDRVKTFYE